MQYSIPVVVEVSVPDNVTKHIVKLQFFETRIGFEVVAVYLDGGGQQRQWRCYSDISEKCASQVYDWLCANLAVQSEQTGDTGQQGKNLGV